MGMYRTVRLAVTAALCVALVSLTGCSQLLGGGSADAATAPVLTVGAPAMAEGPLLAEIYGQVFQSHSYNVFYNFGLTSRDEAFAALQTGMIDFLPDFSGEVLAHLYPEAKFRSSFEIAGAARKELTAVGLTMLKPSPAESGKAFVTTRDFAQSNNVESIGQIAAITPPVTIGAAGDFEASDSGRATLKLIYAITNWKFLPIANGDATASVDALVNGAAQIVVMDSTSPLIKLNNLVVIADPSHAIPANNLIPIMYPAKYSGAVENLVDTVSKALTTEQLQILSAKRAATNAPSDWRIARDWLTQNKLLGPNAPRS